MKFLIVFALALAVISAKDLHSRSIEVAVLKNEGRIIKGKDALPGQFKYQVGIILTKGKITHWCSGSLIGNNWVLSAAHCTVNVPSVTVFLGATQRLSAEKVYTVDKANITFHPHFDPTTHTNDISLLRIPTTPPSSKIGIVKIASNQDKHVGDNVVVSGWGLENATDNGPTNSLKYGILKISPDSVCSNYFHRDYIEDTSICVATFNGVSVCHGDAGSPLVLEEQNLQIGLVSFGLDSCTTGHPTAFTRVGFYHFWIVSVAGISR